MISKRTFLSRTTAAVLAVALIVGISSSQALPTLASPGGLLDTSFGTDGKVTTSIGSGADVIRAIAIQTDGKLVAAGHSHNGTNDEFALARYNGDGTLDRSFGTNGQVTTSIWAGDNQAHAVALQGDKIIVAGHAHNGRNDNLVVVRYNANGALDTSFGKNGIATVKGTYGPRGYGTSFPANPSAGELFEFSADATGIAAKVTGLTLEEVTTASSGDIFQRIGSNWVKHNKAYDAGSAFPSSPEKGDLFEFNVDASGLTNANRANVPVTSARAGEIFGYTGSYWAKHTKKYASGTTLPTSPDPEAGDLFRFTAAATGLTGATQWRLQDVGSASGRDVFRYDGAHWFKHGRAPIVNNAKATAVSVVGDSIVVDGYRDYPTTVGDVEAGIQPVRLQFSASGTHEAHLHHGRPSIAGDFDDDLPMVAMNGNRIAVAGTKDHDFAVSVYITTTITQNGTTEERTIPDTSFHRDGIISHDFGDGTTDKAYGMAWVDGDIVVVGTSDNNFAMVRYATDGTLVTEAVTEISSGQDIAYAVTEMNRKIVAAGSSGDDFAVVRYTALPLTPTITSHTTCPSDNPGIQCEVGERSITFSWEEPDGDPTSYDIRSKRTTAPDRPAVDSLNGFFPGWIYREHTDSDLTHTISGLRPGKSYNVQIRARNALGVSPWTATEVAIPQVRLPNAPTEPIISEVGQYNVVMQWARPTGEVEYYDIQAKRIGRSDWRYVDLVGGADMERRVWGLIGGAEYTFRIRSANSAGPGPWVEFGRSTPEGIGLPRSPDRARRSPQRIPQQASAPPGARGPRAMQSRASSNDGRIRRDRDSSTT